MLDLASIFSAAGMTIVLIYMCLAWAMWLPLTTGQFAFFQVGSVAIGGYLTARIGMTTELPLIALIPIAFIAGLIFGIVPAIMTIRLSGFSFALATLALAEAVRLSIVSVPGLGGSYGLAGIPASDSLTLLAGLTVAVLAVTSYLVSRAHSGRVFDVIEDDELLAKSLGVGTNAAKITVIVVSSGVAAVGGALLASYTGYLAPNQFGLTFTTQLFAYVIVGGTTTFFGPLVGAFVLTIALDIFSSAGSSQDIIFGGLLILMILVRSDGLLGRSGRLHRRRLRALIPDRLLVQSEGAGQRSSSGGPSE